MNDEEQYLKYLKKQEFSPNTIRSSLASYRQYHSLHDDLSAESLLQYKEYLLKNYKMSTVNNRIYGINRYLEFRAESDFRLSAVRLQQTPFLDTIISQEDYEHLKQCLKKGGNLYWYFVVRFLACTGARVGELIQIKAEHLSLGYMDLYAKGGKVRRIYFPEGLCREALQWISDRGISSGFIFTGRSGKQITPRGIGSQLKVLALRYGIPSETVYPHAFRHRFAKNFLAKFNDISLLADLMGHESIETTRIYLTKSSQEQRELIDRIVTW
ncbi:MAG: tyrosine-type recombinase/integrase [Enterocloster sp.]